MTSPRSAFDIYSGSRCEPYLRVVAKNGLATAGMCLVGDCKLVLLLCLLLFGFCIAMALLGGMEAPGVVHLIGMSRTCTI